MNSKFFYRFYSISIIIMGLIACLLLLFGCCSVPKWICVADVNKDSKCKIISCDDVGKVCKTGKYRILKIYPFRRAYVYSVDPPTDMNECLKVK